MKIEFTPSFSKQPQKKVTSKKNKLNFKEFLEKVEEENSSVEIEDLSDEEYNESNITKLANLIDRFGEKLSSNPTIENFNSYKKAIKLLLQLLKKNFETRETLSKMSLSKQKLYKTVEIIDQNLFELGNMILCQEKNRLSYLKLIQNIKGLIIDLIL